MPDDQPRTPFDEQAALKELERLQHDLEESRQRRKDASAAFDEFVNSFRKEPDGSRADGSPTEARRLPTRLNAPTLPAALTSAPRKRLPVAGVVAGGIVAVAAGFLLTRVWRDAPTEQQPVSSSLAVQTPTAAGTPPALSAGPGESGAMQAELVAIRGVWVRATADGVRLVERELRADERVPLRASRSIVIRAGDAGAVKMFVGGQDRGVLGPDGIVITRTFTAPAPAGR